MTNLFETTGTDDYLMRLGYQGRSSQIDHDRKIDIDLVLRRLPEEDRRILSAMMDGKITDAARKLGIPRTTLTYKLQRLRKVLRDLGLDKSWSQHSSF